MTITNPIKRIRHRTTEERRRLEATAKLKRPRRMLKEKRCKQCNEMRDAKEFDYAPAMIDGMRSICRVCLKPGVRERARRYRQRRKQSNPQFRESDRITHRQRTYGVGPEQFNQMLKIQNNACAICEIIPRPDERPLNIDHDHQTGAVRALLCNSCNTGISRFKDSPELIEKAKQYLLNHQQLKLVV